MSESLIATEIMLEAMYVSAIQPDQRISKWAYFLLTCWLNLQAWQSKRNRNTSKILQDKSSMWLGFYRLQAKKCYNIFKVL